MKKLFLLLPAIFTMSLAIAQRVGIGTVSPNSSAMLDISSTTRGLLIPRMTTAQRNAIASPATGLLIYQTDNTNGFYYNLGTPSLPSWAIVGQANTSVLIGSLGVSIIVNSQPSGRISSGLGITSYGYRALSTGTDAGDNTAFGYEALVSQAGSFNTAQGYHALYNNTGDRNVAAGWGALETNTSSSNNTALGSTALRYNTGAGNTATGQAALNYTTTGNDNTANGRLALWNNTNGNSNVAVGANALSQTAASSNNTVVGSNAASAHSYGWNNVFLGANATGNFNDQYNAIAIGQGATANGNSEAVIGNTATTWIGGAVGWSADSDGRFKKNIKENVPGLQFITRLRPVTYQFDAVELDAYKHKNLNKESKIIHAANKQHVIALKEKEKIVYTGFIAQEVEKTVQQLNFNFSGVNAPRNEDGIYSLSYAEFVVPLVKAVQEQQQMIEAQNKRIDELLNELQLLKSKVIQ